MLGLLGRKVGMTQIFDSNGILVPVTVVDVSSNCVVERKEKKTHGYDALVLGFEDVDSKGVSRPVAGYFEGKCSVKKFLKEFHGCYSSEVYPVGKVIGVDVFEKTGFVDISSVSKGKGFAGAIKRHGFHGGRETHGSKFHRGLGSTGQSATPSNTKSGRKMSGRAGGRRVSVQNLKIVQIDSSSGLLIVRGSVPGANKSLVLVRRAVKRKECSW